jgi:hypothetical protein
MKHEFTSAVACTLLAFTAFAIADDLVHVAGPSSQRDFESERIVHSEFDRPEQGRRLYLKHHHTSGSLELCGDLCDFFAWKKLRSKAELWDFVVLYEYQRGIGSQLEGVTETYKPQVEAVVPQLLAHYESYCPAQTNKDELLSCVLEKLAERNQLRIGFVTYDEGGRCLAWGDVRDRAKISEYQCTETGRKTRSTKKPKP